jgi:hypothetical protein
MAVYAVYTHTALSPDWELREVFDDAGEAERYAEMLVETRQDNERRRAQPAAAGEAADTDPAAYVGGDSVDEADPGIAETLVDYYPSRADVPNVLPHDRVAATTARFVRAGFGGWPT